MTDLEAARAVSAALQRQVQSLETERDELRAENRSLRDRLAKIDGVATLAEKLLERHRG